MAKYDLNAVVAKSQKLYAKDEKMLAKLGMGNQLRTLEDKNFLIMPEFWRKMTNVPGLPYNKIVQVAGDSDSGKTSMAIQAMKAAQAQDVAVLYAESEGKTSPEDLEAWGVDASQIMLVQSSIAEELFDLMFTLWENFFEKYPEGKLLVIVDSIGNVVSKRDAQIKLVDSNQKPGGKGQINRLALNKMVALRDATTAAILIMNYTYDNLGSPGKTNAGGKAINFFSSLTYQTSRKAWLEKTVKGEKVRVGAKVQWKLFKNHLTKSNPGPKVVELDITSEGIDLVGAFDE